MPKIGAPQGRFERIIAHTFFDETITASENSASFNCEEFTECTIVCYVSAASGTTPTLVPEVEISGDDTRWAHRRTIVDTETEGSLTRLTAPTVEGKIQAAGTFNCQMVANLGKHMRVGLTVADTDPSFTVNIVGYFR